MASSLAEEVNLDEYEAVTEIESDQVGEIKDVDNSESNHGEEDEADTVTYIQIECSTPNQIFTFDQNDLNRQLAPASIPMAASETTKAATSASGPGENSGLVVQHEPPGRVPPWAYASPKYSSTPMYNPTNQIGSGFSSNPLLSNIAPGDVMAGVRPAIFRPRKLIPFPGTNGYPKYDDRLMPVPGYGPVAFPKNNAGFANIKSGFPGQGIITPLYQTMDTNWNCSGGVPFSSSNNNLNQVNGNFNSANFNNMMMPGIGVTQKLENYSQRSNVNNPSLVTPQSRLNGSVMDNSRKRLLSTDSVTGWDTNSFNSGSGICKKQRIIFSDSQCARLREAFDSNPYLSKGERVKLAEALDITEDNVSVWFKNHRSKLKKRFQNENFKVEDHHDDIALSNLSSPKK